MQISWSKKYEPTTLSEYVFTDQSTKDRILTWVSRKNMPHAMFSGVAGTGKTTLARLLPKAMGFTNFDILSLNASKDLTVGMLRESFENFAHATSTTRFVIIDEADAIKAPVQKALMGLITDWEQYIRFIIIANDTSKLQSPLHSRCMGGAICTSYPDRTDFEIRLVEVLINEKIQFDYEDLLMFVDCFYPRMRDSLDMLEQYTFTGKLILPP